MDITEELRDYRRITARLRGQQGAGQGRIWRRHPGSGSRAGAVGRPRAAEQVSQSRPGMLSLFVQAHMSLFVHAEALAGCTAMLATLTLLFMPSMGTSGDAMIQHLSHVLFSVSLVVGGVVLLGWLILFLDL